ncbi:MAG: hypothetical protein K0S47_3975 [Herbinix sp.]|jgi:hypothetical protein|nr:hypothetical protein [Herbinix sp.]
MDYSSLEFQCFADTYMGIYKNHGHKFIIVKSENNFEFYDTQDEALKALSTSNEVGTYEIFECDGDPDKHLDLLYKASQHENKTENKLQDYYKFSDGIAAISEF